MKTLTLLLLSGLFTAIAFAYSVPPIPLEDRVASADHIIIAVASKLEVLDETGKPMTPPRDGLKALTYRLTIEPAVVLRSNAQPLPKSLTFTYSFSGNVTFESEQERLVGKKLIYLLRGTDFTPVSAYQITEPFDSEQRIRELMQKEKQK